MLSHLPLFRGLPPSIAAATLGPFVGLRDGVIGVDVEAGKVILVDCLRLDDVGVLLALLNQPDPLFLEEVQHLFCHLVDVRGFRIVEHGIVEGNKRFAT